MRVSRKQREPKSQESKLGTSSLDNFQNLGTTDTLVKPVINKDQVMEMSESEYITKFNIKTETYREQACRVLNILDSKGVNIYSEDNTPGMYLRKKGNQQPPAGLSNLFRKKKVESQQESTESIPNELRNFFKSKNK